MKHSVIISVWLCRVSVAVRALLQRCGEHGGYSSVVVHGRLTEGASLAAERGLQACGLPQLQLLASKHRLSSRGACT